MLQRCGTSGGPTDPGTTSKQNCSALKKSSPAHSKLLVILLFLLLITHSLCKGISKFSVFPGELVGRATTFTINNVRKTAGCIEIK